MENEMKRILALVLTLIMSLSLVACGNAKDGTSNGTKSDNYPEKPITVIVPFSAGGEHDLTARTIATRLQDMFGWTVVIQNTSGVPPNRIGTMIKEQRNDITPHSAARITPFCFSFSIISSPL